MRYLIIAFVIIMLSACEHVRHKIGITTKPFSKNDGFENSTKLNYSIIFGKVRPKEDDD